MILKTPFRRPCSPEGEADGAPAAEHAGGTGPGALAQDVALPARPAPAPRARQDERLPQGQDRTPPSQVIIRPNLFITLSGNT